MPWIMITGCSTGIGLYCAKELKAAGYQVIATARKDDDLSILQALGLHALYCDMDDEKSIEAAFSEALTLSNNQLSALFNNAAYGQPGAVEDLPTAALKAQFQTNVFGWHHLTRLAVAHFRKLGHGRIIQNSSVLGFIGMPYRGAYNASKFALEGLTDTLRIELMDTDIQVALIEPGPIVSKFRENAMLAFKKWITIKGSAHQDNYEAQLARLSATDAPAKFTLGPDAVYDALIHALESKKAKARYYVTFPTKLFGFLKRILPTSMLDKMIAKAK